MSVYYFYTPKRAPKHQAQHIMCLPHSNFKGKAHQTTNQQNPRLFLLPVTLPYHNTPCLVHTTHFKTIHTQGDQLTRRRTTKSVRIPELHLGLGLRSRHSRASQIRRWGWLGYVERRIIALQLRTVSSPCFGGKTDMPDFRVGREIRVRIMAASSHISPHHELLRLGHTQTSPGVRWKQVDEGWATSL